MGPKLIFVKTDQGEDAVHARTRLVQRNLRNVLILVDGKASVDDLIEKTGSAEMVHSALEQLEKDGFIRRLSGWGGGENRSANVVRPAGSAVGPGSSGGTQEVSAAADWSGLSVAGAGSLPAADMASELPLGAKASAKENASAGAEQAKSLGKPSVSPFDAPAPAVPAFSAFGPVADAKGPNSVPPEDPMSRFSALPDDEAEGVSRRGSGPRASAANPFQASVSPFGSSPFGEAPATDAKKVSAPESVTKDEKEPDPEPSPQFESRERSFRFKLKPVHLLAGIGVLLIGFVAALAFYPYGKYRASIEVLLSEAAGQPVTIAAMEMRFSPAPTLVLEGVKVGSAGLSLRAVEAMPSLSTLMGMGRSFSRVRLVGASVPIEHLGGMAAGIGAAAQGKGFAVGKIDFVGASLHLRDVSLRDFSGSAELGEGGVRRMALVSSDGNLRLAISPEGGIARLVLEGEGWKASEKSPFVFDTILLEGALNGSRLTIDKVEGRIFGGVLKGQLLVDWATGVVVSGDVSGDFLSGAQLAAAFDSGSLSLDGQLNVRIGLRANGENWQRVAEQFALEGEWLGKTGGVIGMDLVEALRRGSTLATRGGATRYEEFKGRFRWDGDSLLLNGLQLESGIVRATGSINVARAGQVSGSFNVALRGSAATVTMPVALAGTLKDPQLFGGRR